MNGGITLSAKKVKRRKKIKRIAKILLLILLLLLLISYIVTGIIYSGGNFTISLDKNLYLQKRLIIYDDPTYKVYRSDLYAQSLDFLDNIKYTWLPNNLDEHEGGSHNGDNYIAYTFYIENTGDEEADYWGEMVIEDVIKRVDEAIRIRVYKNGEYKTYAKLAANGQPEENTVPFESDKMVMTEHVEQFMPGDINKYTVVIWIEGTDLECTDNILGGEIKIHMSFNSEYRKK